MAPPKETTASSKSSSKSQSNESSTRKRRLSHSRAKDTNTPRKPSTSKTVSKPFTPASSLLSSSPASPDAVSTAAGQTSAARPQGLQKLLPLVGVAVLTLVIQAVLNALVVRVYGVDPQMERVRKKVEDEAGWGVVGGLILWKSIEVLIGLGAMELDLRTLPLYHLTLHYPYLHLLRTHYLAPLLPLFLNALVTTLSPPLALLLTTLTTKTAPRTSSPTPDILTTALLTLFSTVLLSLPLLAGMLAYLPTLLLRHFDDIPSPGPARDHLPNILALAAPLTPLGYSLVRILLSTRSNPALLRKRTLLLSAMTFLNAALLAFTTLKGAGLRPLTLREEAWHWVPFVHSGWDEVLAEKGRVAWRMAAGPVGWSVVWGVEVGLGSLGVGWAAGLLV